MITALIILLIYFVSIAYLKELASPSNFKTCKYGEQGTEVVELYLISFLKEPI